ncbi:hypothetical protein H311_02349, partial [Anncaliia algerae PRA109]
TIASNSFVIDEYINKIAISFVEEDTLHKLSSADSVMNYFLKFNNKLIFFIIRYFLLCEDTDASIVDNKFMFTNDDLIKRFITSNHKESICGCIFRKDTKVPYKFNNLPEDCSDFFYHRDCKNKKVFLANNFFLKDVKDDGIEVKAKDDIIKIKENFLYINDVKHSGMTYLLNKGTSLQTAYDFYFK